MRILTLDLATRSGFAVGPAGTIERAGSKRFRDPEDEPERAFRKFGCFLRDEFTIDLPDLVVIEAPMNMGGMVEADEKSERGFKFKSKPETIYLLTGLVAVAHGICGPYGVRAINVGVQKVRKHFLGVSRPSDPKKAVVARCHLLGLMPKNERDDNKADAIAMHVWASDTYGRPATRDLHFYGETAA